METGLRQGYQIVAAMKIREALGENLKFEKNADEFLRDFCDRSTTISQACFAAAKNVKLTKQKSGQKPLDWYDNFTRVIVLIARKNNIRTTIVTDRETGKPRGRFLELGAAFEKLLYPAMRSPSRSALAKRLSRSLGRIK